VLLGQTHKDREGQQLGPPLFPLEGFHEDLTGLSVGDCGPVRGELEGAGEVPIVEEVA